MRVLTAISGGVDSSVAALLLKEQGHEVVGVFMRNGVTGAAAQHKSCCSASDAADAARVAERLGASFYAVDYSAEFDSIIAHFTAEYARGRTPNPCVLCNQRLKFGHILEIADGLGADAVATGHYAQVVDGQLKTAVDAAKDQSYYLFGIARAALPRILFPLGGMTKPEVRARARAAGLVTAEKPESMEICFVPSGDYRDVVRARQATGQPGRFIDASGRELGRHEGVGLFTVGQRRGLPAMGEPWFVVRIDAASGDIELGPRGALAATVAVARGVNWLVDAPDAGGVRAEVKVRARATPVPAQVVRTGEGEVRIEFDEPVEAVTPGQAAVFYRGDLVLGGGWLD